MGQRAGEQRGRGSQAWRSLFDFQRNGALPFLFILLILLPLADMVLHLSREEPVAEKRLLAPAPRLRPGEPWAFLKDCESYFNDHFGFRDFLVRRYNTLMVHGLGTSPTPKVLLGRRGWLFMGSGETEYFRNLRPFTAEELRQLIGKLEKRRAVLAAGGSHFLLVIAPNKSTIYPEHMPRALGKVRPQSRLDQLLAHLARHPQVDVLDLRPALLASKGEWPLYDKTDTHWNALGACIAYREMGERLQRYFPDARPLGPEHFRIGRVDDAGGDLAEMLSMRADLRETRIILEPKVPWQARPSFPPPGLPGDAKVWECASGRIPRAVIVGDSFAKRLLPFLAEHFARTVFIEDRSPAHLTAIIEREKPQVVIEEMVERNLLYPRLNRF
jgi:hypothetical protein